jgi:electron transport complex protein RnfG
MPEAETFEAFDTAGRTDDHRRFHAKSAGGGEIGTCVKVTSKGFKDDINKIVGIDSSGYITGVRIISMEETPGLGSKTQNPDFLEQYTGKSGRSIS